MSRIPEQLLGAALFVLMAIVGWAPYIYATAVSGIYVAPAVMLGGLFAILAIGFTYDAAERLFGSGKGIYAAAVFVTLPPAAIVFSEPPLLAESSLMFITAATVWFASRASQEQPREALAFIAILSAITLAVFGFWPPAFLPLLSLLILRQKAKVSARILFLAAAFSLLGLAAKIFLQFNLPQILGHQADLALTLNESGLLIAPWIAIAALALIVKTEWARPLIIGCALLTFLHVSFDGEWIGIVGAASPLLTLGVTAVILRWFHTETEGGLRAVRWSVIPLVLALIGLFIAHVTHTDVLLSNRNHVVIGLVIATALIAAAVRDGRRWIFALTCVAGLHLGTLWWYFWREEINPDQLVSSFDIVPWLLVTAVLVRLGTLLIYGRRMPRRLRAGGPRNRFDDVVFRSFANVRRKSWEGDPVSVAPAQADRVRFAVFGDVTGSESPFSSRQSGYYSFLNIVKAIADRRPDFAVLTGDLAAQATHLAYRRLRVLLRNVPFPFIVTPGNHDVAHHGHVQAQFFHALFGSDHGDLTIGPVRLLLINTAWGNLTDEQWQWVEQTLAKPSAASSTLVFCHKPVFDPREGTFYGMESRPHAERLHALFVKHSVTAVFSGHIHSLLHTERDGVTYIISGGGGSKLKSAADVHHFLWCEATRDGVNVTAFGSDSNAPLLTLELGGKS